MDKDAKPPTEIDASQKALLKLYTRLHGTRPSSAKILLLNLPKIGVLSVLIAAMAIVGTLNSSETNLPFWLLPFCMWFGITTLVIVQCFAFSRQWAVIDRITKWDDVQMLLQEQNK